MPIKAALAKTNVTRESMDCDPLPRISKHSTDCVVHAKCTYHPRRDHSHQADTVEGLPPHPGKQRHLIRCWLVMPASAKVAHAAIALSTRIGIP